MLAPEIFKKPKATIRQKCVWRNWEITNYKMEPTNHFNQTMTSGETKKIQRKQLIQKNKLPTVLQLLELVLQASTYRPQESQIVHPTYRWKSSISHASIQYQLIINIFDGQRSSMDLPPKREAVITWANSVTTQNSCGLSKESSISIIFACFNFLRICRFFANSMNKKLLTFFISYKYWTYNKFYNQGRKTIDICILDTMRHEQFSK